MKSHLPPQAWATLLFIALVWALGHSVACAADAPAPAAAAPARAALDDADADAALPADGLTREYVKDAPAADDRYGHKPITVAGVVQSVSAEHYTITLRGCKSAAGEEVVIVAYLGADEFANSHAAKL